MPIIDDYAAIARRMKGAQPKPEPDGPGIENRGLVEERAFGNGAPARTHVFTGGPGLPSLHNLSEEPVVFCPNCAGGGWVESSYQAAGAPNLEECPACHNANNFPHP